jgi:very-short-patch-repair endonuclease/dTDP-glucose pyrophosphorylase
MKGQVKDMYYGASHLLFKRAEELRKFCTWEEEEIWNHLSGNSLGVKFRRQHPLLFYIADFYCHKLKLVIEIDGGIHNKTDVKVNDKQRQKEIEELGISVMRFTNSQVKNNPEIILEQINKKIEELKSIKSQSSPLGAGGLNLRAMIFSAGLGTRFKPWTDSNPKALALVNGKSLLQRNIEYLQKYGIRDVVVNVHHFPEKIKEAIQKNNGWGSNVIISDETDEVLETGGGLIKARQLLESGEPFLSFNVDILTNLDLNKLMAFHTRHKPLVTFGVTNRKSSRVLLFDEDNRLCGWKNLQTGQEKIAINKPGLVEKAYSCVVIYEPEIFSAIKQTGKFSIMDSFLDLAAEHVILGYDHSGDKLVDVGKPESIAVAEHLFP